MGTGGGQNALAGGLAGHCSNRGGGIEPASMVARPLHLPGKFGGGSGLSAARSGAAIADGGGSGGTNLAPGEFVPARHGK